MSRADGRVIPKSQVGTDGDLMSQRVVDPSEADKRRAGIALVEAWQRSDTSTWDDLAGALQMLGIAPSPKPAVERDPVTRHARDAAS